MSSIEVLRTGVDWLSLTLTNDAPYYNGWRRDCTRLIEDMASTGYSIKHRAMLGYIGVSADNCFIGARDDGTLLQLTGFHADLGFETAYHPGARVPRVDIQVTATFDVMPTDIIDKAYIKSVSAANELPNGRKRKVWKIVGNNGGETLYIGSSSSDQYGYIYNKEVQSEDPLYTRCWRYEVRFKNELAKQVYSQLVLAPSERHRVIAQLVGSWFGLRGVDCPWTAADVGAILPIVKTQPSDIERSLWWLERQVKPVINRLDAAGVMDQAMRALGLIVE